MLSLYKVEMNRDAALYAQKRNGIISPEQPLKGNEKYEESEYSAGFVYRDSVL